MDASNCHSTVPLPAVAVTAPIALAGGVTVSVSVALTPVTFAVASVVLSLLPIVFEALELFQSSIWKRCCVVSAVGTGALLFSLVSARVRMRDGKDAGLYSTQSYDATNIFLAGLEAGKTSHADMNTFIGAYTKTGVSGPIKFDSKGDISAQTIYAYKVTGGKLDTANPTLIK